MDARFGPNPLLSRPTFRLLCLLIPLFGGLSQTAPPAGAAEPRNLVITNFRVTPAVVRVGEAFTVRITVMNAGRTPALTQMPPPGTAYRMGESWASRGFPAVEGRVRVGVSVSGPRGREYPYRWGLGKVLPATRYRTVTGRIVFDRPGAYSFYAAAIVEGEGMREATQIAHGFRVLDGPRRLPRNVRPVVPPTRIEVNGRIIDSPLPPIVTRGSVFVPIRFPSEALGADVEWEPIRKVVRIRREDRNVRLQVGSFNAWVNDDLVTLYRRPFITQARTYVPLRFVAESLNAAVTWDGRTRTVRIQT